MTWLILRDRIRIEKTKNKGGGILKVVFEAERSKGRVIEAREVGEDLAPFQMKVFDLLCDRSVDLTSNK
jgi:hypothetical protein